MSKNNPTVDDLFSNVASIYDQRAAFNKSDELMKSVSSFAKKVSGSRVVDIGVGTGNCVRRIVESAAMTVGVDKNLDMLQKASERGVIPILGDARSLPLMNGYFDGAFIRQLLQYFDRGDVNLCLEEARRVLKKGGFLLCQHMTAPSRQSADRLKRFMCVLGNPHPYLLHEEFQEAIRSCGFSIEKERLSKVRVTESIDHFCLYRSISSSEALDRAREISTAEEYELRIIGDQISYNRYYSTIESVAL